MSTEIESTDNTLEQIQELIKDLDNQQLVLLASKLASPNIPLSTLASELYPNITAQAARQLIYSKNMTNVLKLINNSPNLSGALLSIKLLPLAVLTLNKLMSSEDTRSNVRATAAKELIRLGESSFNKLIRSSDNNNPNDNVRKLLSG